MLVMPTSQSQSIRKHQHMTIEVKVRGQPQYKNDLFLRIDLAYGHFAYLAHSGKRCQSGLNWA
jgi:hypothetical protein